MIRMKNMDGSVFREDFKTPWDALRTAKKQNGEQYKKVEAESLPSGTVVYRAKTISAARCTPSFEVNGHLYAGSYGKVYGEKLVPFVYEVDA